MKQLALAIILTLLATSVFAGNVTTLGMFGTVASGGLIGNPEGTADGSKTVSEPFTNIGIGGCFVTTTAGTVSKIHAFVSSATGNFNGAIYNSDGTTLLAEGNLTAGPGAGQLDITLDSPISISAATTYCLVIGSNDDTFWTLSVTNTPTITKCNWDTTWTVADALPATWTSNGSEVNYTSRIWADNN